MSFSQCSNNVAMESSQLATLKSLSRTILFFATLWFLCCTQIAEAKKVECEDTETLTEKGLAFWKFTDSRYITSENVLCWKDNDEILLRECNQTTGNWVPEISTCKVQPQKNTYCPEELIEIQVDDAKACLKISEQTTKYDDTYCYGSSVVLSIDFVHNPDLVTSIMQALSKQNIQQFWVPIRRNNNTEPFQIRLPGERWGQVVDGSFALRIPDYRSDKNCLSVNNNQSAKNGRQNNKFAIETTMTHCHETLHSVCIFREKLLSATGCPNGYGALAWTPNECYGINCNCKTIPHSQHEIGISEYFQKSNALKIILKKFGWKKSKRDFFQVHSFMDESGQQYVVLINKKGEVRVENQKTDDFPKLNYISLTKDILNKDAVEMILKVNTEANELLLIVYNRQFIWHTEKDESGIQCFTTAEYELQKRTKVELIWENEKQKKSIFKVKLVGDTPGEYWCEAHTIFNFALVSSQKLVAAKKSRGHSFAMQFSVPCEDASTSENLCNNTQANAKKLARNVYNLITNMKYGPTTKKHFQHLEIHKVRIMHIESISNENVACWIHVTASAKNSAVDNSENESSEEDDSIENENRIRHDTSVRMNVWVSLIRLISLIDEKAAQTVRSTEYCFPEIFHSGNETHNQWLQAARGQLATTLSLCLKNYGMPYTRLCNGDFVHGAYWEELPEAVNCQNEHEASQLTEILYSLDKSNSMHNFREQILEKLKDIIAGRLSKSVPADIYFIANILGSYVESFSSHIIDIVSNTTRFSDMPTVETNIESSQIQHYVRDLVIIYNSLMEVKRDTIKLSAHLNSTNKLLEAFENAIDIFSSALTADMWISDDSLDEAQSNQFEVLDYADIGVSVKVSKNLLYFVIDPSVGNISGVALFKNNINDSEILTGAFKKEHYRFLQLNHTIQDFLDIPNLELATYVPEKLLTKMIQNDTITNITATDSPIIVIKIYSNDRLFQDPTDNITHVVSGRVVSISIPGYNTDLPELLPLAFRSSDNESVIDSDSPHPCSYWNFQSWASDGIIFLERSKIDKHIILCGCTHLTPFAYLVGGGYNLAVDEDDSFTAVANQVHKKALDIITLVGCSLSVLGISGVFITAALFQSWRQKASSKVLLQLSAAIFLQMIIFCFINTDEKSIQTIIEQIIPSCVAIGASLHYCILVQFCWMMIIAYLQFKRYVQVFGRTRPKRFFIKSAVLCWGLPLIPVLLVVFLDRSSFGERGICYPSGAALIFGIILPITIIILTNFVIFCIVIYNVLRSGAKIRRTDNRMFISQIRLSILLFFLLGFTWVFGLLSAMTDGIVFSYLFCITATLQGFVIFVYFIILDPVTRRMWGGYLCKLCGLDQQTHVESSKDTTETF